VGIDRFGASAPAEALYEFFDITVDHVVAAARESIKLAAQGAGVGVG